MTSILKSKSAAHSIRGLALLGLATCVSAPATAAKGIGVCAAETAASAGVDEGVNGAADAASNTLGLAGFPVSDEGLQLALDQVNANLAAMTGFLVTIATSTCDTNNTVSTSPDVLSLTPWTDGLDTEPAVLTIPAQVGGATGVASSPAAKEVDVENTLVLSSAEASLSDPEGSLLDSQSDGLKNMQGIALGNMGKDKLTLKEESLQIDKLKTATNIKNLLATEGIIQISAVDALNRIDESLNQLSVNAAQIALNHSNEEKLVRNDHQKTAKLFTAI